MTIDELQSQLKRFRIRPVKKLGQNFLLSEGVLEEIVAASELQRTDQVLEIGAGLGVLTRALAERAGEVVAVEKDRALASVLRVMFRNNRSVKVIHEDALFFDPLVYGFRPAGYKLIANLPYYITGAILEKFLAAASRPSLMVLLLQKEVAERVTAMPGDMSILSVSVQLYSDPEIIDYVGKDSFYPAPEVDSAIVRLRALPRARFDVDEKRFFQLVKIGFSNKRKQLHNNLQAVGEPSGTDYKKVLQDLGLNPLARAQDLSLQDWHRLYKVVSKGI